MRDAVATESVHTRECANAEKTFTETNARQTNAARKMRSHWRAQGTEAAQGKANANAMRRGRAGIAINRCAGRTLSVAGMVCASHLTNASAKLGGPGRRALSLSARQAAKTGGSARNPGSARAPMHMEVPHVKSHDAVV